MTRATASHPPRRTSSRPQRKPILPERLLAKLWRSKAGRSLRTTDGRQVKVIYPGRPAPGHGPDFQDAIIEIQGQRIAGPVELHRTPSDWYAHGHHHDQAYDNVVLHVVGQQAETRKPDARLPHGHAKDDSLQATAAPPPPSSTAITASPETLPTLELSGQPNPKDRAKPPGLLAPLASLDAPRLREELRAAGLRRFNERTTVLVSHIERRGAEQTLLSAIMDSLGYSENREPFAQLADRLPFAVLRAAATTVEPGEQESLILGLLLAGAGLGPVGNEWNALIGTAPMRPTCWKVSGVRPPNHPARRIAALAAYIAHSIEGGLVAWLTAAQDESPSRLLDNLQIRDETTTYVGEARAREIIVNAVLPTLAAEAQINADEPGLAAHKAAYANLPALPENTITKEAKLLLGDAVPKRLGACEQQGLIHLYRATLAVAGSSAAALR